MGIVKGVVRLVLGYGGINGVPDEETLRARRLTKHLCDGAGEQRILQTTRQILMKRTTYTQGAKRYFLPLDMAGIGLIKAMGMLVRFPLR